MEKVKIQMIIELNSIVIQMPATVETFAVSYFPTIPILTPPPKEKKVHPKLWSIPTTKTNQYRRSNLSNLHFTQKSSQPNAWTR